MTPIQFGHINIDGTIYPVKFGTAQSRDYCHALNCDLKDYHAMLTPDETGNNKISRLETNGDEMVTMVWSALKQGARVERKPFDLTLDDVADIIDYMNRNTKVWDSFFAIMMDSSLQILESPNETPAPEPKPTPALTA